MKRSHFSQNALKEKLTRNVQTSESDHYIQDHSLMVIQCTNTCTNPVKGPLNTFHCHEFKLFLFLIGLHFLVIFHNVVMLNKIVRFMSIVQ